MRYLRAFWRLSYVEKHNVIGSIGQLVVATMGLVVSIVAFQMTTVLTRTQVDLAEWAFLRDANKRNRDEVLQANEFFNLRQYRAAQKRASDAGADQSRGNGCCCRQDQPPTAPQTQAKVPSSVAKSPRAAPPRRHTQATGRATSAPGIAAR